MMVFGTPKYKNGTYNPQVKSEKKKSFFPKITLSQPKITKNRYEILFFNKENLCKVIKSSENLKLNTRNTENNNNNKEITENTNLGNVNLDTATQALNQEIMNSKCSIDFNKYNDVPDFYKTIYPILQNTCYLRMYFRYTDDQTLAERFKKNGKKDFNYIKKYNSSMSGRIIRFFQIFIIKYFSKEYNTSSEEIIEAINKYNEVTKKLDKDTENKIDNILNPKKIYVNDNNKSTKGNNNNTFNEGKHYKNIEKVLNIIKEKTNGYIDYCIILDIKKSNFRSINSINKKINYSLNNQSGGAVVSSLIGLFTCMFGISSMFKYKHLKTEPYKIAEKPNQLYVGVFGLNKKERDIKLNKKINELEKILFHYPRIYLVKNCLPYSFKQYQKRLLYYDSYAVDNINVQGIDIIQGIIEAELTYLYLKNYKLNIFTDYYTRYIENHFIDWKTDSNKVNSQYRAKYKKDRFRTYTAIKNMIFKLSQDRSLQDVIRKKLDYIGREDGEWYQEFKNNIQFINSPRGSPGEQKWLEFANWWKRYWPYGHNLNKMAKTYEDI